MTAYRLGTLLLNGKPFIVNEGTIVPPPTATLTLATIVSPQPNVTFNVTGGYANFTPTGLQYSITSTNGVNGTWINTVSPTISSGAFSFAISGGLPVGTYIIWVRASNNTAVYDDSNGFTIQQPINATLGVNAITAPPVNSTFTVGGTYGGFTMAGLDYSTNSTNGVDGTWIQVSGLITGNGTYQFGIPGLGAGTYKVWIRRDDDHNLFAASNSFTITNVGTGGSLALTNNVIDTKRVFSRDVTTGNPSGFSTTYNKGWSAVPLTLTPSQAGTLFAALYDADSVGATSTVGTGTRLMAPAAVASLTVGANTINLNVPAGPKFYYMDLSLSSDMTGSIRTKAFGVGYVVAVTGQSIVYGWFNQYEYQGATTNLDMVTTFLPQNVVYGPGNMYYGVPDASPKPLAIGSDKWQTPAISSGNSGPYSSTFSPELLSRIYNKFGVVAAMIGFSGNGWPIQWWNAHQMKYGDGTYGQYDALNALLEVLGHADYKIDTFIWGQGDSNVNWTDNEYGQALHDILDVFVAKAPKPFNVIASISNRQSYASSFLDYVKINRGIRKALTYYPGSQWFDQPLDSIGPYVHPSWAARIYGARGYYRLILNQLGLGSHGPTFTGVASRSPGSALITLNVQQDGGTALLAHLLIDNTTGGVSSPASMTDGVASSVDLAKNFYVVPAGSAPDTLVDNSDPAFRSTIGYTPVVALDATNPVSILGPTQIILKLAAVPLDTEAFDVYHLLNVNNAVPNVAMICDNVVDNDGIPYGRPLRQLQGALYVPPATPVSAGITITKVNGKTSSRTTSNSALTVIRGTYTGAPPAQIDVSWDGSTYVAGVAPFIDNAGNFRVASLSPSANGTPTVTVKIHGTSTVSAGVVVTVSTDDFPISGVALDFDTRKIGSFFTDTARTALAADNAYIKGVSDASGAGNHLFAPYTGMPIAFDVMNSLPVLCFSAASTDARYSAPTPAFMGLQTVQGSTLPAQLRNASYTILAVVRPINGATPNGAHVTAVFTAETAWTNGGAGNAQALAVYADNDSVGAQRYNSYNGNTGAFGGPTVTELNNVYPNTNYMTTTKIIVRFDVSTGTLKVKRSGGIEQTSVVTGDFNTGKAWDYCSIGFQAVSDMWSESWFGNIARMVVVPGHYASDAERDSILAYADRIYDDDPPPPKSIWVGQNMSSTYPGSGYETFAEAKALLITPSAARRVVYVVANEDPNYYADDNGVRTGDSSLNFPLLGPITIIGVQFTTAANVRIPRPRLGGTVGSSSGGAGLGSSGFLVVGDGDVTINNVEFSYCQNGLVNTPGAGIPAVTKVSGTSGNLIVENCKFSNCNDNIRTPTMPGTVTITNSEFTGSGPAHSGSGFNCNVKVGVCANLAFMGNTGHTNSTGYDLQNAATISTVASNTMV